MIDSLIRHAVQQNLLDAEPLAHRHQVLTGAPQLLAARAIAEEAAAPLAVLGNREVTRARFIGRPVEQHLVAQVARQPLVPHEEAADVGVLLHAGVEKVIDAREVVGLQFAMADRFDRVQHRGAEQLAQPARQYARASFAHLPDDHGRALLLLDRGLMLQVHDEHRRDHDGDQSGE